MASFIEWELNPAQRGVTSMKRLEQSLSRWGALYPVQVVPASVNGAFKLQVVEGHRRLRLARKLALPLLPYWRLRMVHAVTGQLVPIEGDDIVLAILDANLAVDKWTQTAQAQLADKNPAAMEHLAPRTQRAIAHAKRVYGAKYREVLESSQMPISLVEVAVQLAEYMGEKNIDAARKYLRWIQHHCMTSVVKVAMRMNVSPRQIERAIEYDEPLTLKR